MGGVAIDCGNTCFWWSPGRRDILRCSCRHRSSSRPFLASVSSFGLCFEKRENDVVVHQFIDPINFVILLIIYICLKPNAS